MFVLWIQTASLVQQDNDNNDKAGETVEPKTSSDTSEHCSELILGKAAFKMSVVLITLCICIMHFCTLMVIIIIIIIFSPRLSTHMGIKIKAGRLALPNHQFHVISRSLATCTYLWKIIFTQIEYLYTPTS